MLIRHKVDSSKLKRSYRVFDLRHHTQTVKKLIDTFINTVDTRLRQHKEGKNGYMKDKEKKRKDMFDPGT